jgi:hypothetical protein
MSALLAFSYQHTEQAGLLLVCISRIREARSASLGVECRDREFTPLTVSVFPLKRLFLFYGNRYVFIYFYFVPVLHLYCFRCFALFFATSFRFSGTLHNFLIQSISSFILLPFVYLFVSNYSSFSTCHSFIHSPSTRFAFGYLFLIIFS